MKKLMLVAVALSVFLGTVSFAQDTGGTDKKMSKKKKKKDTDSKNVQR
jgi:hypothetical protein